MKKISSEKYFANLKKEYDEYVELVLLKDNSDEAIKKANELKDEYLTTALIEASEIINQLKNQEAKEICSKWLTIQIGALVEKANNEENKNSIVIFHGTCKNVLDALKGMLIAMKEEKSIEYICENIRNVYGRDSYGRWLQDQIINIYLAETNKLEKSVDL